MFFIFLFNKLLQHNFRKVKTTYFNNAGAAFKEPLDVNHFKKMCVEDDMKTSSRRGLFVFS